MLKLISFKYLHDANTYLWIKGLCCLVFDSEMPRTVAPRLFCDICDVFDQHDTEDCPVQASSNSPPPRPVHHEKVLTNNDRPYCDICEGN